ncbi:hypothetical protein HMPREF2891_05320 [Actinomyces sp. HMSC065F11]|nr:hypothetical protein HMPREF2891_05320 [Actinomyces sp. HMSC065F11]
MLMPLTQAFIPSITAIGGSLTMTALVSLLPLIFFFVALGAFRYLRLTNVLASNGILGFLIAS